jgi:hypothetical protein
MGEVVALRGKRRFRRPEPSSTLGLGFAPSEELEAWARAVFIEDDGPLCNPQHEHLKAATIGFAWAGEENSRNGRRILGLTELMPPQAMGKWQKGRASLQMAEWFGEVPDFLITIDAVASTFDDASFCALIEHELYHCAQKLDAFGEPKFNRDTGDPMWGIRGHDVEEFVGVVARYGTEATGTTELVKAGAGKAIVAVASVTIACGTCAERKRA